MKSGLNIVFTGDFGYPKGMAGTKKVQNIIDYLLLGKSEVKLILLKNDDDNFNVYGASGQINNLKYKFYFKHTTRLFLIGICFPYLIFSIFYYLLKWKTKRSINILYVYNSLNIENILFVIISKLIGYKIVVDIVEDYSLHKEIVSQKMNFKLKTNFYFEKNINFYANGIIVLSTYLEKKFSKISNTLSVINIPVCARNNDFEKSGHPEYKIFLYSGSFGEKDGLVYLIKAFLILNQKYPKTKLFLSGAGNNPLSYLKDLNNQNIEYLGLLSDSDYYRTLKDSDFLCMTRNCSPYANAGFPFKLGEYLATGNPVIASNVSDVSIYLENKVDALIVEPENVDELVKAMEYLISSPQNAREIGGNGKLKWEMHFNFITNGEILYKFLLQI